MTEAELEKYYDELLDLARRVFGADKIAAEDVVSDTIFRLCRTSAPENRLKIRRDT